MPLNGLDEGKQDESASSHLRKTASEGRRQRREGGVLKDRLWEHEQEGDHEGMVTGNWRPHETKQGSVRMRMDTWVREWKLKGRTRAQLEAYVQRPYFPLNPRIFPESSRCVMKKCNCSKKCSQHG
jgi:hypothetical protein